MYQNSKVEDFKMDQNIFHEDLLKDKVAIVTGASGGIGRGIVSELLKVGSVVVLVDVNKVDNPHNQYRSSWIGGYDSAQELAEEIKKTGHEALALECDVTKEKQVIAMIKNVHEAYGKIEILVNNAGAVTMNPVSELKEEEWDYILDLNTKAAFFCAKHVIPIMINQNFGRIINISSNSGLKGYAGQGHYCTSKFGLIGFTQTLALELAPNNITANVVCPGIIASQMWKMISDVIKNTNETPEQCFQRAIETFIPLKRPQTPEDIGRTVIFIAAMENITGTTIPVTGGIHISSPPFK